MLKYEMEEKNNIDIPTLVFVPEKQRKTHRTFIFKSRVNLMNHLRRKARYKLRMFCHKMHQQNLF